MRRCISIVVVHGVTGLQTIGCDCNGTSQLITQGSDAMLLLCIDRQHINKLVHCIEGHFLCMIRLAGARYGVVKSCNGKIIQFLCTDDIVMFKLFYKGRYKVSFHDTPAH